MCSHSICVSYALILSLSGQRVGDQVQLDILRNYELITVSTTLKGPKPLVPVHNYESLPSYFIVAGLVFVNLVQPYL